MTGRLLLLFSVVLGPTMAAAQQDRTITPWGAFNFRRDEGVTSGSVAGAPDAVFRVTKAAFEELGIALKDNPTARQLGAIRQRAVRRLGKTSVSNYLSCGTGLTGPNADMWHVSFDLGVTIEPSGGGASTITMRFTGVAVDTPNGRSERVNCTTTGKLELEVIGRLRDAFPGTP